MSDNLIKKNYESKIKFFIIIINIIMKKAIPRIINQKFDDLKKKILDLEKKYSFLKQLDFRIVFVFQTF